ncbi:MAG TPA: zinc-dependent metalloprotease [Longimicrobiales bacterium]|nr:zinc-dependent metalloprotease [Longimicrobiales bacterium]
MSVDNAAFTALCVLLLAAGGCSARAAGQNEAQPRPQAERSANGDREEGIEPYSEAIPRDAVADTGMFVVHTTDEQVLFEIPDSLLGREMLMISRWARVPTNFGGFNPAGFSAQEQIMTWERRGERILLRKHSYDQVAADSAPIALSVVANNLAPIVASFPIEAITPDSSGVVIDVTEFYEGDTPAISGLSPARRREYGVRRLDPDRSYINSARSYPMNVEVRHTHTFEATTPPSDEHIGALTVEMNQSLVLLPREPMRPRHADDRVGYFSIRQVNFGIAEQKAPEQRFIRRWRLEPKDMAAYRRGELVEPVKPIVYYLDPATPPEYRSCVRQGIEDWQAAFETAGFRNAILAADPPSPAEDPDWNPEDVRYSVVRWAASLTRNAQGPSTSDPRTGEIIESDIVWYHNHLRSYRNRLLIETGAANPAVRGLPIDDAMMCEAMRQVVAHEVGHALGLPHNMISSSAYPVDSLRSKSFAERMGVAPSIMDYARQNYIAQPGDGLTGADFIRQIGPYDHHAINWGYRVIPDAATPEAELETLDRWITEKADDPVYRFLQGSAASADPRAQTEDIGDDHVRASTYGIANLKRVLPNLIEWTTRPGEDYTDLEEIYGEFIGQWSRYVNHVAGVIGGVYADLKTSDQAGAVFTPVPRAQQERALSFIAEQVLEEPLWILDADILERIGTPGPQQLQERQARMVSSLLSSSRLARMVQIELTHPAVAYPVAEYLDDVRSNVWGNAAVTARNAYRRALHRAHVGRLTELLNSEEDDSDVRALARAQLVSVRAAASAAAGQTNGVARAHLRDVVERIDQALDPRRTSNRAGHRQVHQHRRSHQHRQVHQHRG